MNAIIRAMERRRSIRNFLPELPDREKLDLIAESGLYAASGMGQQAAITLIVTDRKVRDRMAESLRLIDGKEGRLRPVLRSAGHHGCPCRHEPENQSL